MSVFAKIISLTPVELFYLVYSFFMLPFTNLSLRLFGFKKNYNKHVQELPAGDYSASLTESQLDKALKIGRIINIAAVRSPIKASCLDRSLLLMKVLKKEGIPCQLKIGADNQMPFSAIIDSEFIAHAWVVSGEYILNDQIEVTSRYQTFPLPPGKLN